MCGSDAALDQALALAKRAVDLDDGQETCLAALGFGHMCRCSFDLAEHYYTRALALNPNNAHTHHVYAVLLACRGDFKSADEHIRKAQSLDPLSLIIRTNIGRLHYFQKNYAKAEGAYQEVLKINPGFLPARQKLWITYAVEGKTEQAAAELENLCDCSGIKIFCTKRKAPSRRIVFRSTCRLTWNRDAVTV